MNQNDKTQSIHKTVLLDGSLNVRNRALNLRSWLGEWMDQDKLLRARLSALDPNVGADVQKGFQIASLRRRLRMRLAQQPIEISTEAAEKLKYSGLRDIMVSQYRQLSKQERLLWLNNLLFILTPDLRELDLKIENVRSYRSLGQQRNFLLGGHSGMGKTTYLDWYASNYIQSVEAEHNSVPIIKIDAPVNNVSAKPIFQRMILECGHIYTPADTDEMLLMKLILFIQKCKVEMIIVDEVEHIERHSLRRRFLEVSNLTNGTPIICASCEPLKWAEGDVEIQGRWNDYFEMKQYTGERLQSLLSYIELLLPFSSPSFLGLNELIIGKKVEVGPAKLIQEFTGGILRDIMMLLADASAKAIEEGEPALSPSILERAWKDIQSRQIVDFLDILKKHEIIERA